MRGLDEARLFYEQQGRAMLRERFGIDGLPEAGRGKF